MANWPPRLIAYGRVLDDATIARSVGIVDVTRPATGQYRMQLKVEYQTSGTFHVSVGPYAGLNDPPSWKWTQAGLPPSDIINIFFFDAAGTSINSPFTFRIYRDV